MKHRLLLALLAAMTFALTVTRAEDDDEDDDQEFDYFSYFSRAHHNLTFGFRATQGAKVKFGNVGSIPSATPVAPFTTDQTANNVNRIYDNGVVLADGYRANEYNSAGAVISTPSVLDPATGRVTTINTYSTSASQVDANGIPVVKDGVQLVATTGTFLSFTPGTSRLYDIEAQPTGTGTVTFTQYSVNSEGDSMDGQRNISGGIELHAERLFSDPSKRIRFSLLAGISLNGINSKVTGTVKGKLHVINDTYVIGTLPSPAYPYTTPDLGGTGTQTDALGNVITYPIEQSPYITLPTSSTARNETDDPTDVDVDGIWEVKGAYVVMKIGPQIDATVTPNLSFNASAGFAAAYAGTNFSAIETTTIANDPSLPAPTITTGAVTSEVSKVLPGYYANLDANWAINERSGLFAGLEYESFTDYDQTLAGRTAKVDLSGNASLRGGLSIKF
ncbi:MAG TPA: hypothetical protein VGM73_08780 [Candidatus Didemnitutus sp.]|jgi:hypothetical protein